MEEFQPHPELARHVSEPLHVVSPGAVEIFADGLVRSMLEDSPSSIVYCVVAQHVNYLLWLLGKGIHLTHTAATIALYHQVPAASGSPTPSHVRLSNLILTLLHCWTQLVHHLAQHLKHI